MKLKRRFLNWAHDSFWSLPLPDGFKMRLHDRYRRLSSRGSLRSMSPDSVVASAAIYKAISTATRTRYSAVTASKPSASSEGQPFALLHNDPKLIAYYLPQFHPTLENDTWWGPGVTEWNNVTRALPQYQGHLQPRVPADLGYYDLRIDEVIRNQAKLASQHGISAFAVYFYWFGGDSRLLEMPLDKMAALDDLETSFCLCWANESWTRRFDGVSSDVLKEQDHSATTYLDFVRVAAPYLTSRNYFQLDGKAVVIIYRPYKIPNLVEVLKHWRKLALSSLGLELHLIGVRDLAAEVDLIQAGFDAQSEFQPAQVFPFQKPINSDLSILNPSFSGKVYDYASIVADKPYLKAQGANFYRSVACGWDNTPRRDHAGLIMQNCTPELYRVWLEDAVRSGRESDLKHNVVFINAWNEWGESAYLEPDTYFGHGFLHATRSAIVNARSTEVTNK